MAFPLEKSKIYQAVLWGGLIAGTLDITAAFVTSGLRGVYPDSGATSNRSGLLGADSFKGGFATGALGLGLHFVIAFGATAVYFAASRRLTFLSQRAFVCGLVYGVAVLNLVVLPISAIAFKPAYSLSAVVTGLMIHYVRGVADLARRASVLEVDRSRRAELRALSE